MKWPRAKTLSNGIHLNVDEVSNGVHGCYIGICCSLPSNKAKTGIRLPKNNGMDFTRRLRGRSYDYDVSGLYEGVSGPGSWSPCCNGCFGVVYNGKQRTVSESLLAIVFARAVRACTFMEFENI